MNTLCILGNSHAGAIKLGWDDIAAEYPGWNTVFFGAHFDHWPDARVTDATLTFASADAQAMCRFTSGGLDHVDFRRYSAFAIVALDLQPAHQVRLFGKHRLSGMGAPASHLFSRNCMRETVLASMRNTVAMGLARTVRSASDAPVVMIAAPLPSESISELPAGTFPLQEKIANPELQAELQPVWRAAARAVAAENGALFLPQPKETLSDHDCFTRHEYALEAVSLEGKTKPKVDMFHMGRRYGAAVTRSLLSLIESKMDGVTQFSVNGASARAANSRGRRQRGTEKPRGRRKAVARAGKGKRNRRQDEGDVLV